MNKEMQLHQAEEICNRHIGLGEWTDGEFAAVMEALDTCAVMREALERISALRPSHANASTAMDLHLTVAAIADSALANQELKT